MYPRLSAAFMTSGRTQKSPVIVKGIATGYPKFPFDHPNFGRVSLPRPICLSVN
jgi:hypothetical protein